MSTFWIVVLIVLGLNHLVNTLNIIAEQSDGRETFLVKVLAFIIYFFFVSPFSIVYFFQNLWEWSKEKQTFFAQFISLVKIWWRYIIKKKEITKQDYQPMLGKIRFWYQHWEGNEIRYNKVIKHQVLKIYLIAMNRYKQKLKDVEVLQNAVNKTNNG